MDHRQPTLKLSNHPEQAEMHVLALVALTGFEPQTLMKLVASEQHLAVRD